MPGYQNQTSSHKEQVRSTLGTLAREGAQRMLISALEQEVEEFLGRARYARADGEGRGYRNGAGNPRKIALGCGTVELRAPRVRDTREPFSSQILPRYQRASDAIRALLPELYLQGLATGDFEPALRTLLGDAAPLSPASIVRLKEQWAQTYTAWKDRSLADHQYAYLWADGLYLKAGPETEHIAVLIVIGVREDGHKELLAMARITPSDRRILFGLCVLRHPGDVNDDRGLRSYDPGVVARREHRDVARTELRLCAIVHSHAEPPRDVVVRMGCLATRGLGDRFQGFRPLPARFERGAPKSDVAYRHKFQRALWERTLLVRSIEALLLH